VTPTAHSIPFVKASACGNDFLLIDGGLAPEDVAEFTRRICDRHDGVGADGVEWMFPTFTADIEIKLINADGSHAEISGNGTRCVAALLCADKNKERISILTGAGLKICTFTGRKDSAYEFESDMGEPDVGDVMTLKVRGGEVRGIPVSMGNPHYVIFVPDFPTDWQSRSVEIQNSGRFPQGVNVDWVSPAGMHDIKVRFFERGAGETMSSGTGSCASAVAAIATRRAESSVKVHAPGGTQLVRLEAGRVFLRGPARLVCQGEFFRE
jgi:diaminopimelate epimerase